MRSICLGRNSKAILLLKSEIQSADETSVGSLIAEDPLVVKIEKLSVENSSGGFDCGYVLNKVELLYQSSEARGLLGKPGNMIWGFWICKPLQVMAVLPTTSRF